MRRWLLVLFLFSGLAFGLTLADTHLPRKARAASATEFQRLTGGLGMGAASAIYYDFSTFDPRLERDCTCSLWPVPGGYLFSPEHRLAVWDPPEIFAEAGEVESRRPGGAR
jgi:hypothetical protein